MQRGYVKLWRKSLESGLLQNAEAWQLMSWCLLKATHQPVKQLVGKQIVELDKGQFIFGRKVAAETLKTSERKIRNSLELLKNFGFLTIKPTNKYSIITIVNWDSYQFSCQQIGQQDSQQMANKGPTNDHKQEHKEQEEQKETTPHDGGDKPKKQPKRFKPPTLEEVMAYCTKRKNSVDPQKFIDHYEANGWMRGRNKIKSWEACVRTWEKSGFNNNTNQQKTLNPWEDPSHPDYWKGR